jgi:hypothetical protein
MSTDSAIGETAEVQQDFADFANIPGYGSASDAAVAYENSSAETVDEFHRNEVIRHLLNEQPDVAFDDIIDSDLYPGDGLISINDSDSMAVIRVDEVLEAVVIETGDSWIAIEPEDVQNVITALKMADSHLEADR